MLVSPAWREGSNMKRLFNPIVYLFLILILTVLTLINSFSPVFSQSAEKLIFAIIPYETREDLDFLFANATRVLEYLEGEDVDQPLFLSLITNSQNETLKNKGFSPKIIDNDTDLSRYTLLYHPKEEQAYKLSSYGEVIPISKHYTLLKSPAGKPLVYEGIVAEFFRIPFSKMIASPPPRLTITLKPTPSPIKLVPTPTKFPIALWLVIVALIGLLFFVAIIAARKKQREKTGVLFFLFLLISLLFFLGIAIHRLDTEMREKSKNDLEIKNVEEL